LSEEWSLPGYKLKKIFGGWHEKSSPKARAGRKAKIGFCCTPGTLARTYTASPFSTGHYFSGSGVTAAGIALASVVSITPQSIEAEHASLLVRVRKFLPTKRYQHSIAVAQFAATLAHHHKKSIARAFIAGLLHDAARSLPLSRQEQLLDHYHGRYKTLAQQKQPALWHTVAGVLMVRDKFKIKDPLIWRAIVLHTTGHPRMNWLDKIIYIADYCARGRTFKGRDTIRREAMNNIDKAWVMVARSKWEYVNNHHLTPHPWTQAMVKSLQLK
jgi:predicted HD superfamily hydrolase involved in NAD metabolism